MRTHARTLTASLLGLVGIVVIGLTASFAGAGRPDRLTTVAGTIWVANRGADTIRGFDAATGEVVSTIAMRDGSQPGDLAYATGKLYVAEEFGTPPAIAIVDLETGGVSRCEPKRGARRHRPVRDGQGRRCGRSHGHAARPVGYEPRSRRHERQSARRGVLPEWTDPVRRERRLERGRRARSAHGRDLLAAQRARRARARPYPGRQHRVRQPANGERAERDRPEAPRFVHGRALDRSSGHPAPLAEREAA